MSEDLGCDGLVILGQFLATSLDLLNLTFVKAKCNLQCHIVFDESQ